MSSWALIGTVVAMLGVAIAVQVYYLRGIRRSGAEVTGTVKAIVYINIGLLALLAAGLLVWAFLVNSRGA